MTLLFAGSTSGTTVAAFYIGPTAILTGIGRGGGSNTEGSQSHIDSCARHDTSLE